MMADFRSNGWSLNPQLEPLRELTDDGLAQLADYCQTRKGQPVEFDFRDYESQTKIVNSNITIDPNQKFSTKLESAKYLTSRFSENFIPENACWDWLSLVYFRQLAPDGILPGEILRIFIFNNYTQTFYPANFLSWAYRVYLTHGDRADFILQNKINDNGKLYEKLFKVPEFANNPEFIKLVRALFFNEDQSGKIGFANRSTSGFESLAEIYYQYERGLDMYHLSWRQLLSKFHRAAPKFIENCLKTTNKEYLLKQIFRSG